MEDRNLIPYLKRSEAEARSAEAERSVFKKFTGNFTGWLAVKILERCSSQKRATKWVPAVSLVVD